MRNVSTAFALTQYIHLHGMDRQYHLHQSNLLLFYHLPISEYDYLSYTKLLYVFFQILSVSLPDLHRPNETQDFFSN